MFLEELGYVVKRRRTLVSFALLAAIPIFLGVVLDIAGTPGGNGHGPGPVFFDRVTHNGVFLGFTAVLTAQLIIIPLIVSIAAGDSIAGEATDGKLRYLLASPVSRTRLLALKSLVALLYATAAALAVVLVGLAVGAALFPVGPVVTLSGAQISLLDGVGRLALVGLLAGVSTFSIVAVGVFASTLTDSTIGAAAITFGTVIVLSILDGIPQLAHIAPLFLTHYWSTGIDLMRSPVVWSGILKNLAEQAGWMVVFFGAAWARFTTKDILS
ncbi:MAG: ABC transporter permease subunit [Actinomycetota bacterium]|nr:ABC transporter permease subunit [Actinomycetota bacterium]